MVTTTKETDTYLSDFAAIAAERKREEPGWLFKTREAAIERFGALGFPTKRDEEWRFTNVGPMSKIPFRCARPQDPNGLQSEQLVCATFGDPTANLLVFVNGQFKKDLSAVWNHPTGIELGNIHSLIERNPERAETLLRSDFADVRNPFQALNAAFMCDGAYVNIPKDTLVEDPIHVLFVSTPVGDPVRCHPRNLVVAEEGGRATIVESYIGFGDHTYLMNTVTDVVCDANAGLNLHHLQRESESAYHISSTLIEQRDNSHFASTSVSMGGALVRNDVRATLDGEGIECTLEGLTMARRDQHVDNQTFVDHTKPNCNSHELYKSILDDQSTGVFNGRILVRKGAQRTDARQTNRNLLLSDDATTNSMPQLEIYADDVKCTHGATTGKIDETELFYLQSRGLGMKAARALLTHAFASEIIGRIGVEPVRAWLDADLAARMRENEKR